MKNTVIKGTGNSRKLKSALAPSTTWEQALAMLIEGTFPVDFNGISIDGIQQLGDPLGKATLLKDETAQALGIPTTSVPDDAFIALYIGAGKYGFQITVLYPNGAPVAGKTVSGLTTITGGTIVTDSNGKALGVSTSPNPTITVDFSEYFDLKSISKQLTSTGKITLVTLNVTALPANTPLAITSSVSTKKFSPMVRDYDAAVVGGGGSGAMGSSSYYHGSGGGGGGNVANIYNVSNNGNSLEIIIGAGGTCSTSTGKSNPGGQTLISGVVSASGGSGGIGGSGADAGTGGAGNGYGGQGADASAAGAQGGSASVFPFGNSSLQVSGGGGGGGCYMGGGPNKGGGAGGSPYGGEGGPGNGAGSTGGSGKLYGGGGGGGGGSKDYGAGYGGNGYQGICYLRWRNKP